MKYLSTLVALASFLSAASIVSAGQKTTNNVYQNGNGNNASPQTSQSISPQTKLSPKKRDVAMLFRRAGKGGAGGAGGAGGGAAGGGAAGGAGGKGGADPLSQQDVIKMIQGGHQFPPKLEAAFKNSPLSKMFARPQNLKAPPSHLADHPSPMAIKALQSKQIPPAILAAAKSQWGAAGSGAGGKGGAGGATGGATGGAGGASGGASGGAGGAKASPKARRDLWDSEDNFASLTMREANPEAEAFDEEDFAYGLTARSAYFDDEPDLDILTRDIDLDDLALFARDALAEADADYDEVYELYARAGPKGPFTVSSVEKLVELIQKDRKAADAVTNALNSDPKLAKYAEELEDGFSM